MIILSLIFFVLICHVVTHRLAARRPHLEFSVQTGDAHLVDSSFGTWFIRSIWGEDGTFDAKREFIVDDAPSLE
jgi:COMPASS component SWD1